MRVSAALLLVVCLSMPLGAALGGGWATLKMGEEEIEVYRDGYGIPHIFAKSVTGAYWAEGYCEAQDRMWQMELFRRNARGELAELLGEEGLKSDLEIHCMGYRPTELQAMFDSSSDRMRLVVTAYTAGVNAFLKEGRLPAKYAELKHTPRAWRETDSLAIGVGMARRFGEAGDFELHIQSVFELLEKKYGAEKATRMLRDFLRESDPLAPTTLNDHLRAVEPRDERHNSVPRRFEGLAEIWREREELRMWREELGLPTYAGSNCWVVAPKKSASGRAILYGGPMMGFRTPSICDEIHVSAPGLQAAGMSFPGVPGVMIGFNQNVAWMTTSGDADLVDIFVLELNPENSEQYRYKGEWLTFERFEAEIKIAGKDPRREVIRRSRYGPLMGGLDEKRHRAYTRAMSYWKQEQRTFEAVMDFNFAASVADVQKSVTKVVTSHNWFAADREGHIGFWYGGAHPQRRKDHDPRLPQKGDGSMDWEGILPVEKWPQAIDPAHGFFANWNNKPSRSWEPSHFGKIFSGQRIIDTLEKNEKMTFAQMESLARETAYHDYLAEFFLPHILVLKGQVEGDAARALELLATYDRTLREGRPEPLIVERWVKGMAKRVFGDEFGPTMAHKDVLAVVLNPLLYILEKNNLLKCDYVGGGDLGAWSREALQEAVKDGLDTLAWKDNQVDFGTKIGRVKSARGRGTFQMTVELGPDGPRASTVAGPGQSEAEDSPHYADQVKLFETWTYKPFVWSRSEMK